MKQTNNQIPPPMKIEGQTSHFPVIRKCIHAFQLKEIKSVFTIIKWRT